MQVFFIFLISAVTFAAGAWGAYTYTGQRSQLRLEEELSKLKEAHEHRLIALQQQQQQTLRETKEENARSRSVLEDELRQRRQELRSAEQRIEQREKQIDRRQEQMDKKENDLRSQEHSLQAKITAAEEEHALQRRKIEQELTRQKQKLEQDFNAETKQTLQKIAQDRSAAEQQMQLLETERTAFYERRLTELERIASLSRSDARKELIASIEAQAREDAIKSVKAIEQNAREDAERTAREIITLAIQRCASDQVSEVTVSVVPLPNDEMKGRIIGREGRNIRTLESLTGVDVIIDDTPDVVILSSFDAVRREIARIALTKLIIDGRIHPTRIEEMVEKARQEVDDVLIEEGQRAIDEANVTGIQPELAKMLGRLHFRASYGQNVLNHSIEVAVMAGIIASEIGADAHTCKVAGLLHDLGKAFDQEVEGPHALISGEIARRFNKSPKIIHAIVAHHATEADPQSLEAVIVQAADAISAARPGARKETIDIHMKRLEALEQIASSFSGVDRCFAVQAGREVRIIVKPDEVDELGATQLARDIARRIENSVEYPGQIRISVVRETRAIEFAK